MDDDLRPVLVLSAVDRVDVLVDLFAQSCRPVLFLNFARVGNLVDRATVLRSATFSTDARVEEFVLWIVADAAAFEYAGPMPSPARRTVLWKRVKATGQGADAVQGGTPLLTGQARTEIGQNIVRGAQHLVFCFSKDLLAGRLPSAALSNIVAVRVPAVGIHLSCVCS